VVERPSGFAPAPTRQSPRDREPANSNVPVTAPSPVPPPTVAPAPTTMTLGGSAAGPEQGAGNDADHAVRESRIGAQVQRIRDEQIRLAANPGVCHDVCSAAGSICLAAQEICRLAGDGDARCGRARGACADAGHQRDGACPVCPPTR
jgi:hypothetical protein